MNKDFSFENTKITKLSFAGNRIDISLEIQDAHQQRASEIAPFSVNGKDSLQGGGNKPVSSGQLRFLHTLCEESNHFLSELCQTRYRKSPESLTGAEANSLIKSLRQG
jgi:hypothetical protein